MKKTTGDEGCAVKFKPAFRLAEYKISVEVIGKHISGLLLIKYMADSSTRIVFTNEMGFSFFDFGFSGDTGFTVYHIIPQMDKAALIKTLRKDFELIMFKNMDESKSYRLIDSEAIYHAYPQTKGVNYYVTDDQCSRLIKMQRSSNKKPVMEAFFVDYSKGHSPDSIFIHHLNFNFSISLKKITPLASQ
ncbi:MAG TPA: hypothetical protein VGH64_17480 [Puia sp.]|jgi:hypothetical protein